MKIIEAEMDDSIIIVRIPLPVIDGTPRERIKKKIDLNNAIYLLNQVE